LRKSGALRSPNRKRQPLAGSRPPHDEAVGETSELDFGLFSHLEGVVHLDAKVADGTLKFGMAEQ